MTHPLTGPSWSITDEALDAIDTTVAQYEPERGGAMIAAKGSRLVVDFVADERVGEDVSYWHSSELQRELNSYLARHGARSYVGTLHSHPSWLAEPSGQDRRAYTTTLAENPALGDTLFPIVVQASRSELGMVKRYGDAHVLDLPHGSIAGYTVVGGRIATTPLRVVPLRADVNAACATLRAAGIDATAAATSTIEFDGRVMPAVEVSTSEGASVLVAFGELYPMTAPVLASSAGVESPAWSGDRSSASSLASALANTLGRLGAGANQHTARLTQHLPSGVPTRFLVVGAGSVGSTAAELLVRSGAREVTVVDADVVEPANLSRTTYTLADVGSPKVQALAARLRAIAPGVRVTGVRATMQDLDLDLLGGIDVAVLGTDDMAAEYWFGHHLYARKIPAVSIKMFKAGDAGEIIIVDPRQSTPCLHCLMGDAPSERGETNYGTGRIEAAPALGPDIMATVARGAKVALALGQESGPLADWILPLTSSGRVYFQQANVANWSYVTAVRGAPNQPFEAMWAASEANPACGVCGVEKTEPAARFGGPIMPETLPPGVHSSGLPSRPRVPRSASWRRWAPLGVGAFHEFGE